MNCCALSISDAYNHHFQKLKVAYKKTKTKKQQSQPSSSTTTPGTMASSSSSSSKKEDHIFPTYVWFVIFIAYHARRFLKKREQTYEEDWLVKQIASLEHYGVLEYEDDFLSVDGSFYGSISNWNGEESNKFDV